MVLPNFFLVGAMKAGTTAVAAGLGQHPDVYACPIKEPNFFCKDFYDSGRFSSEAAVLPIGCSLEAYLSKEPLPPSHIGFVSRREDYETLFRGWSGQKAVGEFSVSYLLSRAAASEIAKSAPHARIIIILRAPLERAISEFKMETAAGSAPGTFADALRQERREISSRAVPRKGTYVTAGLYADQVKRYLDHFGPDQVFILRHEDLRTDFSTSLQRAFRFLDVDDSISLAPITANAAIAPRSPILNRFLQKSGLKAKIRRYAPRPVIEMGKRVYYGKRSEDFDAQIAPFRGWLADTFNADLERLRALTGLDVDAWTVAE